MPCKQDKANRLRSFLKGYGRVGVAFSGGVDSSLLLKTSLEVLGSCNVLVLYAETGLVCEEEKKLARTWLERHSFFGVDFLTVKFNPLAWQQFVENSERRCYYCKLQLYREFKIILGGYGISHLLDGTNQDDLKENRPGLRAIKELGVETPLVQAELSKADIRLLSREEGLDTWDQPSSSCLATRIPQGMIVTKERLAAVAGFEATMKKLGFHGCRVRLHPLENDAVYLQIKEHDFKRIARSDMRLRIVRSLMKSGINHIFLDLAGR